MTRKMTITLEEELLAELDAAALHLGKKKAQIVREALLDYLKTEQRHKREAEWKLKNREAISEYNERIESEGVFSDGLRSF